MKIIWLLLFVYILSSCATQNSQKIATPTNSDIESEIIEEIANYFIFDYVDSLTSEDYYTKLDSIKNGSSDDFFSLRMAYTKTDDYSPYGFTIRQLLGEVNRLVVDNDFDSALSILSDIQEKEYTNIQSHFYSGYIHDQLGDSLLASYHFGIYDGLLNSIYISGDGLLPETAYIVINTKEEYDFLNWFSLEFIEQALVHIHGYSFDLMRARDQESGDEHELYFNVHIPFNTILD